VRLTFGVPPTCVDDVRRALGRPRRRARHRGALVEFVLSAGQATDAAGDPQARAELKPTVFMPALPPLFELAQHWQRQFALLLRPPDPPGMDFASVPTSDDAATVVRGWIVTTLPTLLRELTLLAAGSDRAEVLHQTRVALRRLRTVLRLAHACGIAIDTTIGHALAQSFRALSATRDRDALLEWLPAALQAAGLAMPPLPAPPAMRAPAAIAADPALHGALLSLLRFALAGARADRDSGDFAHRAQHALRRLHARIARGARHFAALSPARQHTLRKRVKRLRYALEYCAERMPAKPLRKHLQSVRAAQLALGRLQDIKVALDLLQPQAARDPAAARALQWLQQELRRAVRRSAKALQRIDAPPRVQRAAEAA